MQKQCKSHSFIIVSIVLIMVALGSVTWIKHNTYIKVNSSLKNKIIELSNRIKEMEYYNQGTKSLLGVFSRNFYDNQYYTDGVNVFYKDIGGYVKIDKADPWTFVKMDIDNFHASDRARVYRRGVEVEGADPRTFKKINTYYSRDENNIYYFDEYGSRKNNYFQTKISDFDFDSLRFIAEKNGRYIRDNKNAYMNGLLIENVDIDGLTVLANGYSKDKNNVYFLNEILEGADTNSFAVLDVFFAKDKYRVYSLGKVFEGADAESFEILGINYARDKNNVYRSGNIVNE